MGKKKNSNARLKLTEIVLKITSKQFLLPEPGCDFWLAQGNKQEITDIILFLKHNYSLN